MNENEAETRQDLVVERHEDMSLTGRLRLRRQDDGDICVAVIDKEGHMAAVEFCIPGYGGRTSPHTHKALLDLFDAMQRDAQPVPNQG